MANLATRERVLREIERVEQLGTEEYLQRSGFRAPKGVYLVYDGELYPARAIWAMARAEPLGQYDNASMYSKEDAFHRLDPSFQLTTQENYQDFLASQEAISDIVVEEGRNDSPAYRDIVSRVYVRRPDVRKAVRERAAGRCELDQSCKVFTTLAGEPYLETHHILALSCQGEDTTANVIALCADHHRECHFGANWLGLQQDCLDVLKKKHAA